MIMGRGRGVGSESMTSWARFFALIRLGGGAKIGGRTKQMFIGDGAEGAGFGETRGRKKTMNHSSNTRTIIEWTNNKNNEKKKKVVRRGWVGGGGGLYSPFIRVSFMQINRRCSHGSFVVACLFCCLFFFCLGGWGGA